MTFHPRSVSLFDEAFIDPPSEAAKTIEVNAQVHVSSTTTDTPTPPLDTGFIIDEDSIDISDLRATCRFSRLFPDSDSD